MLYDSLMGCDFCCRTRSSRLHCCSKRPPSPPSSQVLHACPKMESAPLHSRPQSPSTHSELRLQSSVRSWERVSSRLYTAQGEVGTERGRWAGRLNNHPLLLLLALFTVCYIKTTSQDESAVT